jgi:hypothetical protein
MSEPKKECDNCYGRGPWWRWNGKGYCWKCEPKNLCPHGKPLKGIVCKCDDEEPRRAPWAGTPFQAEYERLHEALAAADQREASLRADGARAREDADYHLRMREKFAVNQQHAEAALKKAQEDLEAREIVMKVGTVRVNGLPLPEGAKLLRILAERVDAGEFSGLYIMGDDGHGATIVSLQPAAQGLVLAMLCPLCGGTMLPRPTAGVHECGACKALLLGNKKR